MISPSELNGGYSFDIRSVQPLEFEELKESPLLNELIEEPESESNGAGGMDALAQLKRGCVPRLRRARRRSKRRAKHARAEVREQMARELEEKIAMEREAIGKSM